MGVGKGKKKTNRSISCSTNTCSSNVSGSKKALSRNKKGSMIRALRGKTVKRSRPVQNLYKIGRQQVGGVEGGSGAPSFEAADSLIHQENGNLLDGAVEVFEQADAPKSEGSLHEEVRSDHPLISSNEQVTPSRKAKRRPSHDGKGILPGAPMDGYGTRSVMRARTPGSTPEASPSMQRDVGWGGSSSSGEVAEEDDDTSRATATTSLATARLGFEDTPGDLGVQSPNNRHSPGVPAAVGAAVVAAAAITVYRLFVDGSCRKIKRANRSGWGFKILKISEARQEQLLTDLPLFGTAESDFHMAALNSMGVEVFQANGPVIRDKHHPYYCGATKHTNNAGELSAFIYGLAQLQHILNTQEPRNSQLDTVMVQIVADSEFALYGLGGIYSSKTQGLTGLIASGKQLLFSTARKVGGVHMIHVRSHQEKGKGNVHNEAVDELAWRGAAMDADKVNGRYALMPGFAFSQEMLAQLPEYRPKSASDMVAQLLAGQNTQRGIRLPLSMQPNFKELKAKISTLKDTKVRLGDLLKDEEAVAALVGAILAKRHENRIDWVGLRVVPADPNQEPILLSPDMKLMDIPFEVLGGALALLHKSDLFYNKKMQRHIARVYLKVLQDMQNALMGGGVKAYKDVLDVFKKWFLINPILATEGSSDDSESIVQHRVQMLLDDKWDSFCIKDMKLRPHPLDWESKSAMPLSEEEIEDREAAKRERKANKAMELGEVAVAVNVVCNSAKPAKVDEATVEVLKGMYPAKMDQHAVLPEGTLGAGEEPPRIWDGPPLSEDAIPVRCEMTDLFLFLQRSSRMVAPGIDGMRYNHLRYIVSLSEEEDPVAYGVLKGLAWLINVYLEGLLPAEVNALFSEAEIFPLLKKTGGIRPIMMINSLRKIAATYGTKQFEAINEQVFGTLQLGIQREFGMEAIVHTFTQLLKDKPHLDYVFADFKNAFNVVDRQRMLKVVEEKFGDLHKFFQACYGQDMHAWVCGEEGVNQIKSSEGVHQGDPLGCIGFALAVHSLFERVLELSQMDKGVRSDRGTTKAYIDDLSTAATFENSLKIIDLIIAEGPQFGIVLNFDKTIVLLGKCGSWEDAQFRQNEYVSRGMRPDNVLVHPEDVRSEDRLVQSGRYGVTCLGVPIGNKGFVAKWLDDKLLTLKGMAKSILSFEGSKQNKLLMMRFSFAQKITYLLRTIEPDIVRGFAHQFNELKISMLCALLEVKVDNLSPMHKLQILTHIRDGGFGLFDAVATASAAYMASVRASWRILREVSSELEADIDVHWFDNKGAMKEDDVFKQWFEMASIRELMTSNKWIRAFIQAIGEVGRLGASKPSLHTFFTEEEKFKKLQKFLFTPIRKRRLENMRNNWPTEVSRLRYADCVGNGEDASAWLEAFPRGPKLTIQNDDFRIMCIMRLGLAFPEILHAAQEKGGRFNYKCPLCAKLGLDKANVDNYGRHLAHGCRFGSTQSNTHNAIRDVLEEMHKSDGQSVSKEVIMVPIDKNGVPLPQNVLTTNETENSTAPATPSFNRFVSQSRVVDAEQDSNLRADLVVRGPTLKLLEVTITDPLCGRNEEQQALAGSKAMPQVEARVISKVKKYTDNHVIVDGFSGRSLVVFCFSTFGRMNKDGFRYIKEMAKDKNRKGYERVRFRQYWFQRLACALQRMLATQYRNNLMVFRGDIVLGEYSNGIASKWDYLENGHVNAFRNGDWGSRGIRA